MPAEFNINNSLFNSISELIKEPFLILDQTGNVLSWNKEAGELFKGDLNSRNLFDIIDESSSEIFLAAIEKTLNTGMTCSDTIYIEKNIIESKRKFYLNKYKEDKENFLFCLFKSFPPHSPVINVNSVDILPAADIIDQSINELIEILNAEVPFTLTGLERIRKKVNKNGNTLWIESIEGAFILISKKYEQQFNFANSRIEGQNITNFLLPVFHPFWKGINEIITQSGSAIQLNQIMFNGVQIKNNEECIKVPVQDSEKKIVAILGIVREKVLSKHVEIEFDEENDWANLINMINKFPHPCAIIKDDEVYSYSSLFNLKYLAGLDLDKKIKIRKVFTVEFQNILKEFSNGQDSTLEFKFFGDKISSQGKNDSFNVYLSKLFRNNQVTGSFLMIDQENYVDDLGLLIKNRGRMFDILLDKNPEPVFIYDTENLRFLDVNEPALNLYGYTKEEFLQMDLTDLYTPEDIQTLLDTSVSRDNYGKFLGPFRHRKKDGTSLFVEISKVNFNYNDKEAHFNIIRNITEQLDLQKKNLIYKFTIENSPSLVFFTDSSGFITYANKSAFNKLDPDHRKLLGNSLTSFVIDEDRGKINSAIFQSKISSAVSVSASLKLDKNNSLSVAFEATSIKDYKGNTETFLIVGNYESEPIVKEVVREVIKEVVKEVPSETVSNVNSAPVTVTSSDIDKNLLSSMFHEILTPINVIIGFIQELTENDDNLTEEQKEAVDIINQNRKTLLNSMNSVVEFVDLEKTNYQLNIAEISVTEIVDAIQKELETNSRDGIDFSYGKISSSLRFENDKNKILQLLNHLISVFSQLNHGKKVYFSAYQFNDDQFVFSVKDSYSSISPELFNSIKNIFAKGQDAKDYGLSKLSLQLIKKLLNLLNGEFRILSKSNERPDYGFVFSQKFSADLEAINEKSNIPITDEYPEPQVQQEEKKEADLKRKKDTIEGFDEVPSSKIVKNKYSFEDIFENPDKENIDDMLKQVEYEEDLKVINGSRSSKHSKKINLHDYSCLYIEDQVDSQILFKVQMKELKDIKFAVSFEEALPLLDNNNFDFIVMDINLQGEYNGLDALKIIHKMPRYINIPIIAVTAYVLPGDKEKFIATGFHDFISKPIFREKMIDSLERIFLNNF